MRIELEFISSNVLAPKSEDEKMKFILDKIKNNKILVMEESLTTAEESRLIEATMHMVDSKFPGIEVSTLRENTVPGIREKIIKLLGGKSGGLTVIGPSKLIKKVKKEPKKISMWAESKK